MEREQPGIFTGQLEDFPDITHLEDGSVQMSGGGDSKLPLREAGAFFAADFVASLAPIAKERGVTVDELLIEVYASWAYCLNS